MNLKYTRLHAIRGVAVIVALVLAIAVSGCQTEEVSLPSVSESDISALDEIANLDTQLNHVKVLASDEYAGRKFATVGEDKAEDYLVEVMQEYGLRPWNEVGLDTYRHRLPVPSHYEADEAAKYGENLIGVIDGKLNDKFLLVGAHYDHLGLNSAGEVFNGADDNGVAVSMVLEFARCLSVSELLPERTLVFVLFTGEEQGLLGSSALVEHLRDKEILDDIIFLNLEMLGGISGDWMDVYDQGMGRSTADIAALAEAQIQETGVKSKRFGKDPGSDARPFVAADVPTLTIDWAWSHSNHPHYHKTSDDYENIKPELVSKVQKALIRVIWALSCYARS